MNHKKIPKKFIDTQTPEYMEIGDIRFVPAQNNFLLDEEERLWIRKSCDFYSQEEPMGEEDGRTNILSILVSPVKVQRIEGGFKAFLHEFEKRRKERLNTCSDREKCNENERICHCEAMFQQISFSKVLASDFNKENYLPVIEFDEEEPPIEIKEDYEKILENLTDEGIKNSSSPRLKRLLSFSIKTENYTCSERIKTELDSRKK